MRIVTIDFWNTLFDTQGGEMRNAARLEALRGAIVRDGTGRGGADEKTLQEAYSGIWDYFDHHWLEHQRTPTSPEMVREICRLAGVTLRDESVAEVADVFERGILEHPPGLLPGAIEGLEYLADTARLALISDTAFSPGTILRALMEDLGIAGHFDVFVFSDQTGVAKPHPKAFQTALRELGGDPLKSVHIGDIERTDIIGAKGVGMKAILYRGDSHKYAEEETTADAVMHHWSEIQGVMETMWGAPDGKE